MVKTGAEHAAIALAIQAALWAPLGPAAAGAVAVSVFVGREVAQNEYGLAVSRGWSWGQEKPVKWREGLTKGWNVDGIIDIALPAIACLGAWALV